MMNLALPGAFAAAPADDPSVVDPAGRVLDVEKLRLVTGDALPTETSPTCDVLVIGGGVGGVAAAYALAQRGVSVILTEPTHAIGGQFTSQLVATPDENSYIELRPGPATSAYAGVRAHVRNYYAGTPDILPAHAVNVGQCWVSRVSGTPRIWEDAFRATLSGLPALRAILTRHQLRDVGLLANGRVDYADLVNLDTGTVTRIRARFVIDATEDGSLLALAGLPTAIGQEARAEWNEPHAPETAHPEWVQSFTYCFLAQWQSTGASIDVPKPDEYDAFKALGSYSLDYEYIDRGLVPYKMLKTAPTTAGSFWAYRRLVAASSYSGQHSPDNDIALINWRGNDFHEESYLGKSLDEQLRVLKRGKAFAQGFLYYLQNECPRDDGNGVGYPEIQPIRDSAIGDVDDNGLGAAPYIRESRRLRAKCMLTENNLLAPPDDPKARWGTEFFDSVGCSLYAIDVHPAHGEPPMLIKALPCHIPLGSFLTTAGPVNVLPGAKNWGATRLALASTRMHPTEWLVGEIAGSLAAFCVRHDIDDPSSVRDDPDLLAQFRENLRAGGVALSWRAILGP